MLGLRLLSRNPHLWRRLSTQGEPSLAFSQSCPTLPTNSIWNLPSEEIDTPLIETHPSSTEPHPSTPKSHPSIIEISLPVVGGHPADKLTASELEQIKREARDELRTTNLIVISLAAVLVVPITLILSL